MIGISGLARSGKDTLAGCLKKIIEKEFNCKVEIVSLAKQLKSDLSKVIACNFHFQSDTDDTEDKNLIRPILVAYGEAMKSKWGDDVWVKKLDESLKSRVDKKFYIVADVRFDFEADYFKDNREATMIHISKNGNEMPLNDVEKVNDPLVKSKCDLQHHWPSYHPDNMHMCDDHAEILWQMIPEEQKEKWKKTLI
tara:strand:- start:343 stop:927 length:585 start_codon:yes stop_codon:yes gene_type:complete